MTESQVSTIVNNAISSGGSSVIRKITRGTSTVNGETTISCSITDTSKVVVILNTDMSLGYRNPAGGAGSSIYLKSVSNSNIIVSGFGVTATGNNGSQTLTSKSVYFSYQIIEFM